MSELLSGFILWVVVPTVANIAFAILFEVFDLIWFILLLDAFLLVIFLIPILLFKKK